MKRQARLPNGFNLEDLISRKRPSLGRYTPSLRFEEGGFFEGLLESDILLHGVENWETLKT